MRRQVKLGYHVPYLHVIHIDGKEVGIYSNFAEAGI